MILDVMLPERDGFQVLDELAATYPLLPVLMLTVMTRLEDRARGWGAGAAGYIIKPFVPSVLIGAVAAALRESGVDRKARRRDALRQLRAEGQGG